MSIDQLTVNLKYRYESRGQLLTRNEIEQRLLDECHGASNQAVAGFVDSLPVQLCYSTDLDPEPQQTLHDPVTLEMTIAANLMTTDEEAQRVVAQMKRAGVTDRSYVIKARHVVELACIEDPQPAMPGQPYDIGARVVINEHLAQDWLRTRPPGSADDERVINYAASLRGSHGTVLSRSVHDDGVEIKVDGATQTIWAHASSLTKDTE